MYSHHIRLDRFNLHGLRRPHVELLGILRRGVGHARRRDRLRRRLGRVLKEPILRRPRTQQLLGDLEVPLLLFHFIL